MSRCSCERWPCVVVPLTAGSAVLDGAVAGAVTTAEAAELAELEPPALPAVTTERTVWPTSPDARVYRLPVAPAMVEQVLPELLQSCHWYA